ncbi:hypothetical protein CCACVL1_23012 [Corchorus capsularis]|uniref:Pentacotripeptide-repeat region of PRORP domain-containing protein n=1 Tax=Corchorus capsularis TaxID=210143 RepID=A0A1R3GVL5_COCAP|nr:hypothetical protein CCACVL1_23012 [Corchorus capsularis]
MPIALHRFLTSPQNLLSSRLPAVFSLYLKHPSLCHRSFSIPPEPPPTPASPLVRPRSRTPLETQFETWIQKLKPGFTSADVDSALRAQRDADLALDIFRWTALQRGYKHNDTTYLTIIKLLISAKRYRHAETLIEEVIAGACPISIPLYNTIIRFCCGPKQMKAVGVIPDTMVLNMIIKAYSKCLAVDEAIRVFREMGLYGCEPNAYTYGYICKGLCEKGRVAQGFGLFKEMRDKGLVPKASAYMILICSLAMEQRVEDAMDVVSDMLGNSMAPDLLTYKTVLEELCRRGRSNDAFELLEEWKKRDLSMGQKNYRILVNALRFDNGE